MYIYIFRYIRRCQRFSIIIIHCVSIECILEYEVADVLSLGENKSINF